MAANVETMFYVREKPWHGLGTNVEEAPTSKEALIAAGLNWNVRSEDIHLRNGEIVEGYKANVRDTDRAVLGVVTDRYRVVQNREAFAFTDALLVRVSGTRRQEVCWEVERYGCWLGCRMSMSLEGSGSARTCCFQMHMMDQGRFE